MTGLLFMALRIAVLVYIGMCVLVMVRQAGYVYYPDRTLDLTPSDLRITFEDIELNTTDGERLHGWFVPADKGRESLWGEERPTVLLCHGNAGDIGDRLGSVETFRNMGMDVFIFDYRGYGQSTGKPSEQGTYLDVRAAWDYLVKEREVPPTRIVLFGRSLGGAIATSLAEERTPAVLVLESTFSSARDMARRMFPFLPIRLVCRFRYDTLARVPKVRCPVLVAHSQSDEMIPFEQGQRVYDAAPDPKMFVAINGGHNDGGLDVESNYQRVFLEFVKQHVGHHARGHQ